MREVRQGQFYRHFKNRLYQVIAVAQHSETGEQMVVYQALYGDFRVYVRPYGMFISEVDHGKYPEVAQKYRFELVEMGSAKPKAQAEGGQQGDIVFEPLEVPEAFPESVEAGGADEDGVNPLLLQFLDADTLEDKLHIMIFNRNQMDDSILNSIAISLDLVVEEKSTQEKYDEILNCLSMMAKFECNRLR